MIFLITMILCLLAGMCSEDFDTFFISILFGIFIGVILEMCWISAKDTINNIDKLEKHKKEIKEQDKYDNDWGIIE